MDADIDHVWDLRLLGLRRPNPAHHEIGHVHESIVLRHHGERASQLGHLAEYWWQIHRSDIYHEAGHTVVASAEGWSVAEIFFNRVDPDAACRYEDRALLSAADHHEALRVAVGGTITEAIHLGDDPSRRLRELLRAGCAEADRGNALPDDRASIRALEPSAGCTASEVVENTERLLRRRWRDVEALVQALDERARATADPLVLVALKGSDVRRLIGGPPARPA